MGCEAPRAIQGQEPTSTGSTLSGKQISSRTISCTPLGTQVSRRIQTPTPSSTTAAAVDTSHAWPDNVLSDPERRQSNIGEFDPVDDLDREPDFSHEAADHHP
eukprot:5918271-Pyramimonas_sp.AAC.1